MSQNSTSGQSAQIGMQAILTLTNNSSGQMLVQIGSFGYATPATVGVKTAVLDQYIFELRDTRPKQPPPPRKKRPITIPADVAVAWIGPYELNQKVLFEEPRRKLNNWVQDLSTRADCQELYMAIKMPKRESLPIIQITGAADGTLDARGRRTGYDDVNPRGFVRAGTLCRGRSREAAGRQYVK